MVHDRSILGTADITDDELAGVVADEHGVDPGAVTVIQSSAEEVPYDLESITTAGRYWVHGTARVDDSEVPFRYFVKHVQSWSRSPLFRFVPEPFQAQAEAGVPWRTEPLIYRSDLAQRLPEGLTVPRAYAVFDIDDLSAAAWLEDVRPSQVDWTPHRLAHAAHLIGRMAASPAVRELASIGEQDRRRTVRDYIDGRLSIQVVPMLRDDDLWRRPLLAETFADVRPRVLAAVERLPDFLAEIERVPDATAHGDACTNNLLVRDGSDQIVLIDFGFWSTQPLGFDLSQLLVGDVQIGRRSAADLPHLEAVCLPAYTEGLRAEGCRTGAGVVRRAHALLMLLFSGFSAFPVEHLDDEPTEDLLHNARERAQMARFILDLVEATEPG